MDGTITLNAIPPQQWGGVRRPNAEPQAVREIPVPPTGPAAADLATYRAAVDAVAEEFGATPEASRTVGAFEARLAAHTELATVLRGHPAGLDHSITSMADELARFAPNGRSAATDLRSLTRILLLHQIDVLWWGDQPSYPSSADVLRAPDLVDLDELRSAGSLRFHYRQQAATLSQRAVRAAQRRILPHSSPPGAGLLYARARPETVALLNRVATAMGPDRGGRSRGLWLNSAVRSEAHQQHLRALGYSALSPSSHCSGYAVDVAVEWLRGTKAATLLTGLLTELCESGEANVIDEGTAWHVCVSPSALAQLRDEYDNTWGATECAG